MFPTFSGNSRRPRQVDLSGRRTNPFAAVGAVGAQGALAEAQQERERRHRERERTNATKVLQRSWRGAQCRRALKQEWRTEWDAEEAAAAGTDDISEASRHPKPYATEAESLRQLQRLLRFADTRDERNISRLRLFMARQSLTLQLTPTMSSNTPWPTLYLRLQKLVLSGITISASQKTSTNMNEFLTYLSFTISQIPDLTARNARAIYWSLAQITRVIANAQTIDNNLSGALLNCVLAPLSAMTIQTPIAYEAFACEYLTLEELTRLPFTPNWLETIAESVNYKVLARSLTETVSSPGYGGYAVMHLPKKRVNLLACLIHFHQLAHQHKRELACSSNKDYILVISTLLSSVANLTTLGSSLRNDFSGEGEKDPSDMDLVEENSFAQKQILSLINQENISSLLGGTGRGATSLTNRSRMDDEAKQLASFALTLLRFFPKKGDEIRMWLYLGSSSNNSISTSAERVPAIKYFWQAVKSTGVFKAISQDSEAAIRLLRPRNNNTSGSWGRLRLNIAPEAARDDWRLILVFFELYTFVLKLMDDEEFFSPAATMAKPGSVSTWASHNALPLDDIRLLTTFLKNLGFSMYFNALEIVSADEREGRAAGSISSYFGVSSPARNLEAEQAPAKPVEITVAGLPGITIDYSKGLVTGLLRMLYERDSRRPFLPKGHWLMTSRFDMEGFIPAVVEEEEKRHKIQEEEDEDDANFDAEDDNRDALLIGTSHSARLRHAERLKRQQRKLSRMRYLQAVAPRLEILQNMPFFIPFETRVQIFREFVRLDQTKRRGYPDPELWRMAQMGNPESLERHQARIHRDQVFEDAFTQFYSLNDGLKEPIQITFVDKFDNEEAGIDGGGVTKEFLTSVTKEAFGPADGLKMFIENDQRFLYPNPAAIDEAKDTIRQLGFSERSEKGRSSLLGLLNRYEFLGRIIGKCLYEGILVDVSFAGFFLLKWALTGGTGSAPRESGYRANLNDLRDLDEALYQGLLQLKNYPGDVSDFSLDFTITDTHISDYETGATKNITRELKPGGANMPVTNENRLVYISYVARHRLQVQPFAQTSAFLRGLSTMIQPSWLSMFNQSELQTLIGGTSSSIDVADLRRSTQYGGVYQIGDDGREHLTIQLFWRVMEKFTDEQRRAVLKFVTSTPRAPLLGFSTLRPQFSIRDSGSDQTRLPSTSTCVNLLKLPMYTSETVLREKLLTAVFSGAGFDLS